MLWPTFSSPINSTALGMTVWDADLVREVWDGRAGLRGSQLR